MNSNIKGTPIKPLHTTNFAIKVNFPEIIIYGTTNDVIEFDNRMILSHVRLSRL